MQNEKGRLIRAELSADSSPREDGGEKASRGAGRFLAYCAEVARSVIARRERDGYKNGYTV